MNAIQTPSPLPQPCEMHSSQLSGTSVLCAGGMLRIISTGTLPWRKVQPGWYSLTVAEREDWGHWACWTSGYYQCGGIEWPNDPA